MNETLTIKGQPSRSSALLNQLKKSTSRSDISLISCIPISANLEKTSTIGKPLHSDQSSEETRAQPDLSCNLRYKKTKYNDSEEQMKKYTTLMSAYGSDVGIDFKFSGLIANTLDAHRLIQHYQEQMQPETADKIVNCMLAIRLARRFVTPRILSIS